MNTSSTTTTTAVAAQPEGRWQAFERRSWRAAVYPRARRSAV